MKVRGDILRTYQKVHTWTGIIAGLVLFIGFYAGALTMFKPAFESWATPPEQKLHQIPANKLDELIRLAVQDNKHLEKGFKVNFADDQSPLTWFEKGGGRGLQLENREVHATLSDKGELVTVAANSNELGALIDHLHRTAGIVGKVGHEDLGVLILGVAAVLYFIALVSGVIFLLPTLAKSFFAVRGNKGASRFWLDSHNLIGIISLPFHIVIAWTVVVFAFHDPFYGGLQAVYGDKPLFERGKPSEITYSIKDLPSITEYQLKAKKLAPEYTLTGLDFARLTTKSPSLAMEIVSDNKMMRGGYTDIIYMNPYTMAIEFTTVNEADNHYGPIVKTFFGLHFGNYAGTFGRWIYFIFGILGAFLFYSGNLLWLEKRRQKQKEQSKSSVFMANLTVGVCLGSIFGVITAILLTKWFYLITDNINDYYLATYYTVFFLSIGYAFSRGAPIAAIHLQKLLAVTCIAIPTTSIIGYLLPNLALWTTLNSDTKTIDFMAIVFALIFWKAAQKTKQRALYGEQNSIWKIQVIDKPDAQLSSSKA